VPSEPIERDIGPRERCLPLIAAHSRCEDDHSRRGERHVGWDV
jgi:hypothetical protein